MRIISKASAQLGVSLHSVATTIFLHATGMAAVIFTAVMLMITNSGTYIQLYIVSGNDKESAPLRLIVMICLHCSDTGTVAENTSMNCNQSMIIVNSSTYTCEGYSQIYECTVDRESATIWSGSAFDCPATNNEIIFLHSAPNAFNASCNGGKITGHIIRSANDSYTSRISVSVSSEMIGHNISCFSDGQAGTVLIGSTDLILTTGIATILHAPQRISVQYLW